MNGIRRAVWASVAADTTVPPALRMARTAWEIVAPVVTTSSTSTNRRPSSRRLATNEPSRFRHRASTLSVFCRSPPARWRSTRDPRSPAAPSSTSTGEKPRRRHEAGADGTGHRFNGPAVRSPGSDWSRAARSTATLNAGANIRAMSVRSASLKARSARRVTPRYSSALTTSMPSTICR